MELEADLAWVCSSGADFVVVDGAEAATRGSPQYYRMILECLLSLP